VATDALLLSPGTSGPAGATRAAPRASQRQWVNARESRRLNTDRLAASSPSRHRSAGGRLQAHFRAPRISRSTYASWLNQIEIVFSVIQRKVLAPNDFANLQGVVDRLDAFERHYNQIATPFEWNFTRRDLADLIARVADHEPRLCLAA
jgi:hypothetical protein